MSKTPYQQAIDYCFRILSKKSYSEMEIKSRLEKYMQKREFEERNKILRTVINRLKELKYINDEQLIEQFVNYRVKFNPCGHRQIVLLLKQKGINEKVIEKRMNEIDLDEKRMALELVERKKNKWLNENGEINRQKLYGFLARRGFNLDTIYKVMDCCYNNIS